MLQSCSSGDDNASKGPEEVVIDNIKPPYTVKYEVTFSSNSVNDTPEISHAYEYPVGYWRFASAPGTNSYVSKSELTNGWVKEFTVTVDENPLLLDCSVYYNPTAKASYTTKMFINNILVKETTWNRNPQSGSTPPAFYKDSYDVY